MVTETHVLTASMDTHSEDMSIVSASEENEDLQVTGRSLSEETISGWETSIPAACIITSIDDEA